MNSFTIDARLFNYLISNEMYFFSLIYIIYLYSFQ